MFLFWHRIEKSKTQLLRRALHEYKSNKTTLKSSWYANILFIGEKIYLKLPICLNLSHNKFKAVLKKTVEKRISLFELTDLHYYNTMYIKSKQSM